MSAPVIELDRDKAHPQAREALTDAFFWDLADPCGPFGDETAREVLEALRDFRVAEPRGNVLALLGELLEEWEVADEVQAVGADDELGLLLRDEAIIALAFAQIIVEGRVLDEVRRRAVLALTRQALPALTHGFGDRASKRRAHVDRMRAVLAAWRNAS